MKALITGINGFTGRHLAAVLAEAGYEVHGLALSRPDALPSGVRSIQAADLNDPDALMEAVRTVQPDVVAHLAAISFVAHGDVAEIYRTNVVGTRYLLDALARAEYKPKAVLVASSANVYGNARGGELDEQTPPAPANDYAVSKLSMEYVARLYADRLPIIVTRPFNYTGVGQSENFLLPKIVAHIRRKAPVIELGNLDVARDFSDVRSVVAYYQRLLETPAAIGETFNVCSGTAHTLSEVLDMVRSISGHDFEVRVNPAFVRANEVKRLLGDNRKLVATVGSVANIPLSDTLRWMIEA